jgi:hypothetical protein
VRGTGESGTLPPARSIDGGETMRERRVLSGRSGSAPGDGSGPGRPPAVVVLVAGLALVGTLAAGLGGGTEPDADVTSPSTSAAPAEDGAASQEAPAADELAVDLPPDTVVAWTRSRLPEGYADVVAADPAFAHVSLVRSGTARLVRTEDAAGEVVDDPPTAGGTRSRCWRWTR